MNVKTFSSMHECEDALLDELTLNMVQTLAQQERFNLALAGGNTPKSLYEKLSDTKLDWHNVQVTLTDERWVDVQHMDSNENMLRHTLLQNQAKIAGFLALKNSEKTAEQGQANTNNLLLQHAPKLDCVLLGMGDDGHFASIFPNMLNTSDLLSLNQTECCLPAHPADKPSRISLTLRYLLSAKCIFLLIKGDAKRQVFEQQNESNVKQPLPIHYLLKQTVCPITVYWSAS
jgi:6-phosphogluconolactonase